MTDIVITGNVKGQGTLVEMRIDKTIADSATI